MPRRDWNAKLDREYERLYEQLARAGAARLGPRRPVDPSPTCVRDGHGPWGPPHRLIRSRCSLAQPHLRIGAQPQLRPDDSGDIPVAAEQAGASARR
jgi:hypothetical protein